MPISLIKYFFKLVSLFDSHTSFIHASVCTHAHTLARTHTHTHTHTHTTNKQKILSNRVVGHYPYSMLYCCVFYTHTRIHTYVHTYIQGGADKSLAWPISRCCRTESIVSLQVRSCYRGWKEACQATCTISTTWRHKLSSSFFFFFSCKARRWRKFTPFWQKY